MRLLTVAGVQTLQPADQNSAPTAAMAPPPLPDRTLEVGAHPYLLRWSTSLPNLDCIDSARPYSSLITIFHLGPSQAINREYLEREVRNFTQNDDVFHTDCLRAIIFSNEAKDADFAIAQDVDALLHEWGCSWYASTKTAMTKGPYYLEQDHVFQLYKIQDDFNHAFVVSSVPSQTESSAWHDGGVIGKSYTCIGVPVPSRLYYEPTKSLPLNGLRIAVKDVFHMKGLRTSVCNRAYHDFYPPQESTAPSLTRLVDCGAKLVGKTHLSSFAWKEEPTDCIDYQAPFNPRGDAYQSPAGSSSGSGAAIASYDWLDFTIGTDTTGSGRRPALWNGCFALRPSIKTLPCEGMVPTCPAFDVPSFFGRDISKFNTLIQHWYQRWPLKPKTAPDMPWTVVYPTDYLDIENKEQLEHIDRFTEDLAKHLGGAEVKRISIAEEWEEHCPVEKQPLVDYMTWVQEHGFYYDAYHCFDEFREKYEQQHGHPPYVSPPTEWMWTLGALFNEQQRDDAMRRFDVFRKWFLEHILAEGKRNSLMILPIETLEARYRDTPTTIPITPPKGISVLFLSPTLGAPELVVPVGHVRYNSKITKQTEHLPVAVSVVAAPDMDAQLVELIETFLKSAGRPTTVQTGKTMFSYGMD